MSALDSKFAEIALRLINKYGAEVNFHVFTEGAYDPSTRKHTGSSTNNYLVVATPPFLFVSKLEEEETMESITHYMYLARKGLPFDPKNVDKLTSHDIQFTVMNVKSLYSGSEIAAYRIELRA